MSEITYILGAGASFQSIPLVSSFNERLLVFSEFLNQKALVNSGDWRSKFAGAANSIQNLYTEFSSHQSFDTYFKKQFHLGNKEKINQGKRLLHLYFIWEHSRSSFKYKSQTQENSEFEKKALFDKRYDALIAGLLKPYENAAETVCKVNFITWNYDLNLIHSIKNFFFPDLKYSDFIEKITKLPFYWNVNDQITIINVNGNFYSSGYNDCSDLENLNGDDIIIQRVLDGYHDGVTSDSDADNIKFAWERSGSETKQLVTHLKRNIGRSNRVIVVGYTFPLYNRFIDSSFITSELLKFHDPNLITIQDPNVENITSTLIETMDQNKTFEQLINKKLDCSSFYVPSNIFIATDTTMSPLESQ